MVPIGSACINHGEKKNRSVGSLLEFQPNEPQNRQEFVTLINSKAAAVSETMELPVD